MVKKVIIDFDEDEFQKHLKIKNQLGLTWKQYLIESKDKKIEVKNAR